MPARSPDSSAVAHATTRLPPRERRRILLDLAKRRQRPGTGSATSFLRRRTAVHPWPDLRPILEGLRWAVIGGVATRAYMPERTTFDLDIVVHPDDAEEAWRRLERAGFVPAGPLAIPGRIWTAPDGVEVDAVEGRYDWIDEALASPAADEAGLPVIGLPYLVIMKMTSSRGVDLGDLTRMLGLASEDQLALVRRALARHAPEDQEDLETLIYLGQQEFREADG